MSCSNVTFFFSAAAGSLLKSTLSAALHRLQAAAEDKRTTGSILFVSISLVFGDSFSQDASAVKDIQARKVFLDKHSTPTPVFSRRRRFSNQTPPPASL